MTRADKSDRHIFYFEEGQVLDDACLATLAVPADGYICGSMAFMDSIIDGLIALEHSADNVH